MTAAVKTRLTQLLPAVPYVLQTSNIHFRWWDASAAGPAAWLCGVVHVLPVSAWLLYAFIGFLPQSNNLHVALAMNLRLVQGVPLFSPSDNQAADLRDLKLSSFDPSVHRKCMRGWMDVSTASSGRYGQVPDNPE